MDGCNRTVFDLEHPAKVELTANLPGFPEVKAAFDRRIKERFPTGSSETVLAVTLAHQGFESDEWHNHGINESKAVRTEPGGLICNPSGYVVYWRTDERGRLTSVRGKRGPPICL